MKGLIKASLVLALILSLFLTGCGSGMISLTKEEEKMIVAYASGAVAKANRIQKQGMTYLPEVEEEAEAPEAEESAPKEEAPPTEEASKDTVETGAEPDTNEEKAPEAVTATFTEVVNLPGITAEYRGHQVQNNYMAGEYFALNASAGNTYLVVNVGLSNTSSEPVECNLFNRITECTVLVNGVPAAQAMTTILLNDLMTYMNTLEASQTEDAIIIFEVPADTAADIQTLALELEADGISYHIALE